MKIYFLILHVLFYFQFIAKVYQCTFCLEDPIKKITLLYFLKAKIDCSATYCFKYQWDKMSHMGLLRMLYFNPEVFKSVRRNLTFVWNSTVKLIPSHCLTKHPMVNIGSVCRWAPCHFHNTKAVLASQQTNLKHNVLAKYTTSAITIELLCLPSWFCLVTEMCTVHHSSRFLAQFHAECWLGWVWDWGGGTDSGTFVS